ncbi:MAG TPA: hypothetical protein VNQ90_05325 [Chthoniobacteraceae bacterium]|nr:hypothetical protein [Chthoniobacteraceae bacterium]
MNHHPLRLTSLCLLLFTLALAIPGQSATLLYDDFQSYTPGSTPTRPNDGNLNNWYFNSTYTAATVAGSSPGGAPPNNQILHVSKPDTGGYSSFGRSFEAQTKDILKVTLNLQFHSFDDSAYLIQLTNSATPISSTNTSPAAVVSLRFSSNNLGVQGGTTGAGAGVTTYWNPQGGVLKLENWYRFEIVVDFSQQKFRLTVTNLTDPSQGGSTPDYYFISNSSSINGLLFRTLATNVSPTNRALDWSLNDVHVQTIPEPAAASLLLGALLLLSAKKLRPRRSLD